MYIYIFMAEKSEFLLCYYTRTIAMVMLRCIQLYVFASIVLVHGTAALQPRKRGSNVGWLYGVDTTPHTIGSVDVALVTFKLMTFDETSVMTQYVGLLTCPDAHATPYHVSVDKHTVSTRYISTSDSPTEIPYYTITVHNVMCDKSTIIEDRVTENATRSILGCVQFVLGSQIAISNAPAFLRTSVSEPMGHSARVGWDMRDSIDGRTSTVYLDQIPFTTVSAHIGVPQMVEPTHVAVFLTIESADKMSISVYPPIAPPPSVVFVYVDNMYFDTGELLTTTFNDANTVDSFNPYGELPILQYRVTSNLTDLVLDNSVVSFRTNMTDGSSTWIALYNVSKLESRPNLLYVTGAGGTYHDDFAYVTGTFYQLDVISRFQYGQEYPSGAGAVIVSGTPLACNSDMATVFLSSMSAGTGNATPTVLTMHPRLDYSTSNSIYRASSSTDIVYAVSIGTGMAIFGLLFIATYRVMTRACSVDYHAEILQDLDEKLK